MEDPYVKAHLRGKRIGFALLRHVAKFAIERDCGGVEWGVLDRNQPSIEFEQKLGAVPMDDWTKYWLTGEAREPWAKTPTAGPTQTSRQECRLAGRTIRPTRGSPALVNGLTCDPENVSDFFSA